MEYISIILISFIFLIILWFVLEINIKKIKEIGKNKELDELTNSFPENIEICKTILKKLNNTKVKIKEDKDSKTNLYMIYNNTIIIANIRSSFTRIQTIAHECIHSVQSKRMLWFNFIYTNIYLVYFFVIIILLLLNVIQNQLVFLVILVIMGQKQYAIRSMLETEAMIKARYIAKEYLEENSITSIDNVNKIITEYDKLNDCGIKLVNYDILAKNIIRIILYCICALI